MESPSSDLEESTNQKSDSIGKVEPHPSIQETPSPSSSTWSSPDSPLFDPFNSENNDDNQPFSRNEESSSVINPNAGPVNNSEPLAEASSSQTREYRIPSSVFASKPSQGEWSITSNESLFSIRVDNVSFKNEWRSGELGSPWNQDQDKDKPSAPDHMFSYSEHQRMLYSDSIRECKMLSEATMKEVLRENESNHDQLNYQPTSPSIATPSRSSHESSMSTTSYAFAMKTGDSERGVLETPRSIPEQLPPPPQVMTEPPAKEEPPPANCERKPDRENEAAPSKKWFSFFPCCSSS